MLKVFNFTTDVQSDRQIHLTLPSDVPTGLTEIVVVVSPQASTRAHTLGELLHSEFFGMWRDREDISDSAEFARRLREEAWSRSE